MRSASQPTVIVEALTLDRREWGNGGSTRHLLEALPFIERCLPSERHADWCEKVRSAVRDPRLSLHLIPPDKPLVKPIPTRNDRPSLQALRSLHPVLAPRPELRHLRLARSP